MFFLFVGVEAVALRFLDHDESFTGYRGVDTRTSLLMGIVGLGILLWSSPRHCCCSWWGSTLMIPPLSRRSTLSDGNFRSVLESPHPPDGRADPTLKLLVIGVFGSTSTPAGGRLNPAFDAIITVYW